VNLHSELLKRKNQQAASFMSSRKYSMPRRIYAYIVCQTRTLSHEMSSWRGCQNALLVLSAQSKPNLTILQTQFYPDKVEQRNKEWQKTILPDKFPKRAFIKFYHQEKKICPFNLSPKETKDHRGQSGTQKTFFWRKAPTPKGKVFRSQSF